MARLTSPGAAVASRRAAAPRGALPRRDDLALVLQGLWFRRWVSLAVLVVASLVVGAAVTGPLFLRAAGESVLRDTLAQALPSGRGVADHYSGPVSDDPVQRVLDRDQDKLGERPTLARLLTDPVASLETPVLVGAAGATPEPVSLVWRDGVCAHVRMVGGTCAQSPGSVMATASTAGLEGWTAGERLRVGTQDLVLAGTYVPLDVAGDYWAGHPYFVAYAGPGGPAYLGPDASGLDALIGPRSSVEDQGPDASTEATVDRHLDLDAIRVTDLPALTAEVLTWTSLDGSGVTGDTAATVVLQQAAAVVAALRLPVLVVEAQLLVLCWLVLFLVVANAAEARGPEVALAKLRGVPTSTTVAIGLLDTVLLVVVAVPLGFGLAWGWTTALARAQLAPGVPVVLTAATGWAAAGAGAGAAVAAVLATSRTLRRPVVEQWRRATRRVAARSWVVDVVVVAVAVAGLVGLLRPSAASGLGGAGGPGALALVAPSLVILAAALVGSRVLPGLCRAAYGPTRRRGRVAALLAVRQLGRRPGTLRLALLLTVAFGLVVFGVDAWSVARANAHDRAWTEVGAAEVLSVGVPPGTDLADVVDRVDPGGTQLTAVSTATDFTRLPPALLTAVEPDRFARIAYWRSDLGPAPLAELAAGLRVPAAPPVLLEGDRLRVSVDVTAMNAPQPLLLVADVVQPSALGGTTPVVLGPIGPGRRTLEADLPCAAKTCRLAGLELRRDQGLFAFRGSLTLTGLEVRGSDGWQDLPAALGTDGGWRPATIGAGAATSGPGGTTLAVEAGLADGPSWQVADHPASLPALVGAGLPTDSRSRSAGFGANALPLAPVTVVPSLPGGGDRGVLVDRTSALRASEGSVYRDIETVWVARGATSSASARLTDAGVTVLATTSASELAQVYGRQGPALALLLFLAGSGLAAVLAGGGAALTLHLNGRRRTYELAAMAALGLRRRTLLASLFLEQGVLVLFGLVVGTAAGIAAATLALPVVPEFSDAPTAPPLRYDLQVGPVLLSLAVGVVVLALAVVASSTSLVRAAHVDQLREAPA
ncbi:FtsX-like permease family protein [Microlunatus flavus]|uniref:FtsX-like permease family protein n=1 Tax=Microlunatus flavus TaxID=1036181 RepID=A0A1H9FYD5_9ACTN|nr:FtsX-like permease family protein [Microlunatus flavus]SEQ42623.1 FtsX-like permease family protein [Microlunatus flavus]